MWFQRMFAGVVCTLPMLGAATAAGAPAAGRVRLPAVQGQFYPADAQKLQTMVDGFLKRPPVKEVPGRIRALICPHAGYAYSGVVAATGFQQVPIDTTRVIVMAPSHHAPISGGSISDVDAYRNALGDVPIDPEAVRLRQEFAFFKYVPEAEAREHSLEVMLPFLQRRLQEFSLVPIIVGQNSDAEAMAKAILPLTADPKTLVVASTDLSHYRSYDRAVLLDRGCLDTILNLDTAKLPLQELCGEAPVLVLMHLVKLKAWRPILVDYRNSGDTAGDSGRGVVGYGCVAFTEESPPTAAAPGTTPVAARPEEEPKMPPAPPTPAAPPPAADADPAAGKALLSAAEQQALLTLVRDTINAVLARKSPPELPTGSAALTRELGCFVTLHRQGELRGCIGNILPAGPLAEAVRHNARSAAFSDRRFTPVRAEEMADIDIEISVLTTPTKLTYRDEADLLSQLRPGVDGVVLSQGTFSRSTYLPQVWEQLPDKEEFLSHLCQKGGMPASAWRDPSKTTVEVYQAFVFGEKTQTQ